MAINSATWMKWTNSFKDTITNAHSRRNRNFIYQKCLNVVNFSTEKIQGISSFTDHFSQTPKKKIIPILYICC